MLIHVRRAFVLLMMLCGCGTPAFPAGGTAGWVNFHPPPLKHAHYYWKQGVSANGGCRFTTNLGEGQEEEEVKVNPVTCLGYFERGDARRGG